MTQPIPRPMIPSGPFSLAFRPDCCLVLDPLPCRLPRKMLLGGTVITQLTTSSCLLVPHLPSPLRGFADMASHSPHFQGTPTCHNLVSSSIGVSLSSFQFLLDRLKSSFPLTLLTSRWTEVSRGIVPIPLLGIYTSISGPDFVSPLLSRN
jgi:hypothetical protein